MHIKIGCAVGGGRRHVIELQSYVIDRTAFEVSEHYADFHVTVVTARAEFLHVDNRVFNRTGKICEKSSVFGTSRICGYVDIDRISVAVENSRKSRAVIKSRYGHVAHKHIISGRITSDVRKITARITAYGSIV